MTFESKLVMNLSPKSFLNFFLMVEIERRISIGGKEFLSRGILLKLKFLVDEFL